MASKVNREERRLQRQRGAGKREVKHTANFDLVLPGQETLPIEPRRSSRPRKTPEPQAVPSRRSSKRTPSSRTIGKRKRPTGDTTFNFPESPQLPGDVENILDTENGEPNKKPRVHKERDDGDLNAHSAEVQVEPGSILKSMEANGGALQKSTIKKRKKRKSIGQQAPRRAKAKVSPNQKQAVQEVKAEPPSSPAHMEGTSRLLGVPTEDRDPVEAQIRQELAGAAEKGLHDSLVEDIETGTSKKAQVGKGGLKGGKLRADPHVYSSPTSTSIVTHKGALSDAGVGTGEDGEEGEQNIEGETDERETEDNGRLPPRAPTAKMLSSPAKPKRKKRKSIGQQKPKRPTAGTSRKTPDTVKEAASSHTLKQPKAKPKQPSASTKKSRQAPSKPAAVSKSRGSPANTVPITIYRPTTSHHDVSEAEADTSNADHDPLMAPLPPPPNTLNAIDVLSQLTRELVAKTASNPQFSSRARKTMQLYGQELDGRTQQLGQALATNVALGQRIRAVNAEEKRTKGEVGDVASEREGVRERIEEAKGLQRGMRLGVLLGGIADWVKKGWAREEAAGSV